MIINLLALILILLFPTLILCVGFKLICKKLHYETQFTISRFFSNLTRPFRNFYDQSERFFFWGWTMRKNYDWDFYGIYCFLEIKLKKLKVCIQEGNATDAHKKKILKPLNQCLDILKRITADDYDENSNKVTEKWGKRHMVFNPIVGSKYSTMHSYNENALNPAEQKIANKEFSKALNKDFKQQEKDRIKLFQLLGEHIESFWD